MAGAFYRVICPECEHEQVVYGKAATPVECAECGETLATPTGGKAAFTGEVAETVESR